MMQNILAQAGDAGSYLAIWKVIIFLALFGLWAWVGQWLDKDVRIAHTQRNFWNNGYLIAGITVLALWILLPTPFIVQVLMFLVIWLTILITYILHRNARVLPEEQLFTADHLRSLMSRQSRNKQAQNRLVFISSHGNELPIPLRQDAEYEGYVAAEDLIYEIWRRRVSCAEILPMGETLQLRYTIDGVKGIAGEKDRSEMDAMFTYLKAVAGMDIKDKRRPQNGPFSIRTDEGRIAYQIKTAGSTRGEQMRIERSEEYAALKLDALGLNPDQIEQLQAAIEQKPGVVIITGPEDSGVTTTLYAVARNHDAFIQNINSLERDILTELDNITQNIVEENANAETAARQLQSLLRKDPDIVLSGFCDSKEMARIITQAAREGKKLYAAYNANNTFDALNQWLAWVSDSPKVADTLLAITCQKLIRVLCPQCREAYVPDASILRKLNLPADKIKHFFRPPTEFEYDKRGNPILCDYCQGTGYRGRTAIFETFFINDAVRQLLRENTPLNAIRNQCRKERMLYLQEQALRKVIDGTTSIQEVLRVTVEKPAAPAPATTAAPAEE